MIIDYMKKLESYRVNDSRLFEKHYDFFKIGCREYEMLLKLLLKRLAQLDKRLGDGYSVLEIGAGDGGTSQQILKACKQAREIVLVEPNLVSAELAKQRLTEEENSDSVRVDCRTIQSVLGEQKSASLDLIVSMFTIHNFPSELRLEIFNEVYRCLSKRGVFVNLDKYIEPNLQKHEIALLNQIDTFFEIAERDNDHESARLWVQHYLLDESQKYQMSESKVEELFVHIGFSKQVFKDRCGMEVLHMASKMPNGF